MILEYQIFLFLISQEIYGFVDQVIFLGVF